MNHYLPSMQMFLKWVLLTHFSPLVSALLQLPEIAKFALLSPLWQMAQGDVNGT